ncbi:Poly(A) RNA polymerase 1 [Lecanosticta acicola]|uniref:polynucleotide adenylyltransferase n=1 Tax=Lecanosticta acicola TaxID=111012 RepID=A0AAI8Z150_9PEZI|nr:Poly(A) RNA polymerase 1 [Lecanosticta acicola]
MGDSYRPGGRPPPRHHKPYNDYYGRDDYDSPSPPPRRSPPRTRSGLMDSHRYPPPPQFPPPRRDPPPPGHDVRNNGYQFRGAAADSYRSQDQQQFSFRVDHGTSAPRFSDQQPPPRSRPPRRNNDRQGGRPPYNRDNKQGGPRKFVPKPAHSRAILKHTDREPTPEQLAGMEVDDHPRFAGVVSSDEDDAASTGERPGDDNEGPRKRTRIATEEPTNRPQWSNPDPYSVLPPTDLGIGPKKDIVQTIRKAKMDVAANQSKSHNAVKENADYISFDFGDDGKSDDAESGEIDEDASVGRAPSPPALPPAPLPYQPTEEDAMRALTGEAERYGSIGGGAGSKRKRGFETVSRGLVTEWAGNNQHPISTPWYRHHPRLASSDGLHKLEKEILDFYDYVTPFEHESDLRCELVDRIQMTLKKFPQNYTKDVDVLSFGSFAAGLYLPTADMDLVAVSAPFQNTGRKTFCQNKNHVHSLRHYLVKSGLCKGGEAVAIVKARVPIIKFADKLTGIKVDISFENDSGLQANSTFQLWKRQYPEMPVLVMLLKQFLMMRGLSEVFNGGIGGFTTICLVVSMLRDLGPRAGSMNLAELFLNFLEFYGLRFDVTRMAISMAHPAGIYDKLLEPDKFPAKITHNRLTIIDPNNIYNDLSGGSREIDTILRCFGDAYTLLRKRLEQIRQDPNDNSSILGCILAGNYASFDKARADLLRVNRGRSSNRMPQILPSTLATPDAANAHDAAAYSAPTNYRSMPPPAQYPAPHPYEQRAYPPPTSRGQHYSPMHYANSSTNQTLNTYPMPTQSTVQPRTPHPLPPVPPAPAQQIASSASAPSGQMYGYYPYYPWAWQMVGVTPEDVPPPPPSPPPPPPPPPPPEHDWSERMKPKYPYMRSA